MRRGPLALLEVSLVSLLAACGNDSMNAGNAGTHPDTHTNAPPVVAFIAPADGSIFALGETVSFAGTISDDRDPVTSVHVRWSADDGQFQLGDATPNQAGGVHVDVASLNVGTHHIALRATDSGGAEGVATITITVRGAPAAPTVSIAPTQPSTLDDLVATVATPNPAFEYRYQWFRNDVAANLQSNRVPAAATARGEIWRVRVTAVDGAVDGAAGEATVTIGDAPPTCLAAILLPSAGTTASKLTCSCQQLADPDGDQPASSCTFFDAADVATALGPDDGSCTLAPGIAKRGMKVQCRLTPGDGTASGEPVTSGELDIGDAKPTQPTATITPTSGTILDTFTCHIATLSTDADGDLLTTAVSWFVNDQENAGVTTASVVASGLVSDGAGTPARHGDRIHCRLLTSDGGLLSSPGDSADVVLGDAEPAIDSVSVRAESGLAQDGTSLVCDAVGATDPDGDLLSFTYVWTVTGAVVAGQTGKTLGPEFFARGDVVICSAVASDGSLTSPRKDSKSPVTILNAPPTIAEVTIAPATTSASGGVITCSYLGWHDADGDAPEVVYDWFANGAALPGEHGSTFATTGLVMGVTVTCAVTPKNGNDRGETVPSADATLIVNAPPELAAAVLGPADPKVGTTLTCTPQGFTDADGDAPVYTYAWTRQGQPIVGADAATLVTALVKGDHIRCQVTPGDGQTSGAPALSNEVVVANSLPTLVAAQVNPTSGGSTCRTYTCVPQGAGDADDDDVAYAFRWTLGGNTVVGQTSATFSGVLSAGASLGCAVRPTDGAKDAQGALVYGVEKIATAVAIQDAVPSTTGVTIVPGAAGVGAVLTCDPVGFSDDCTTEAVYLYQWYVNDTVAPGATAATFDTTDRDLADKVHCQATPFDGTQYGVARISPTVALGPGQPTAARVAVQAPQGANGPITCALVTPARWLTNPSYTYYWRVNGGAEVTGGATLTGVSDCDLVACRAVATDVTASLSSVPASNLLPVGSDCDDGNQCTQASCKPTGGCENAITDGATCDDANPCTTNDKCGGATCIGYGNVAATVACDDGAFCTTADHCDGNGHCGGGGPTCTVPADSCKNPSCNEATDSCSFANKDDGSSCDADHNGCTVGDACLSGFCMTGTSATCAGDECKIGVCQSTGAKTYACTTTPKDLGTACVGGDFCMTGLACDAGGSCVGGVARDCVAEIADPCFDAYCDSVDRKCVPFANLKGTPCNDANDCTLTDACDNGVCKGADDICFEEPISLANGFATKAQPSLGHLGFGRYVTSWPTYNGAGAYMRITASHDSREGTQQMQTAAYGYHNVGWSSSIAVRPDGSFASAIYTDSGAGGAGIFYNEGAAISVAAFDPQGVALQPPTVAVPFAIRPQRRVERVRAVPFLATTGGFSLMVAMTGSGTNGGGGCCNGLGENYVVLYPSTSSTTNWALGNAVALQSIDDAEDFDGVMDGSGALVLGYASAGQVLVRKVAADGTALGATTTVQAAVSGVALSQVRLDRTPSGYVVVWSETPAGGATVVRAALLDAQLALSTGAFVVDEQPTGVEWIGDVAVFSDGGFVVVYESTMGDVDGYGIRARLFDELGVAEGPELAVNARFAGQQRHPSVVALPDDEFVVAWHDNQVDPNPYINVGRVWTRRFTRGGDPQPGRYEHQVNLTEQGAQANPSAAKAVNGRFMVAFDSPENGLAGSEVFARIFDSVGGAVTSEVRVNTTVANAQTLPIVGGGPDRFFVVWRADLQDGSGQGVYGRVFDSSGVEKKAEFLVNKTTAGDQLLTAAVMNKFGEMLVLYTSGGATYLRIFDKDGAVLVDESQTALAGVRAVVADPATGVFVVVDSDGSVVHGARIGRDGAVTTAATLVSDAAVVNQTRSVPTVAINGTAGTTTWCWNTELGANVWVTCRQTKNDATFTQTSLETVVTPVFAGAGTSLLPRVAYLISGQLMVAWQDPVSDGSSSGADVQKLASDLSKVGTMFTANREWAGAQAAPFVLPTLGSAVIVGWTSAGQDGSGTGVFFRALPSN